MRCRENDQGQQWLEPYKSQELIKHDYSKENCNRKIQSTPAPEMTESKNTPTVHEYVWDEALIKKYDLSGPRYTSYPTAPQFSETFGTEQWKAAVNNSNLAKTPLSLYFHIPFCDTVCYYCACNKIITANKSRALPYLANLHKEIAMQAEFVTPRPVHQLHWGGGTPTYISDDQMSELMAKINQHFPLLTDDSGEYSIEIHPADVTPQRISHLRTLGFNRLSMGVQDFNPEVQTAVNRFNSEQQVTELIQAARADKFHSISIDLIYGLPKQNRDTFATTLDSILTLRPDRISLFNYAHMPQLFKTQRQIDESLLPEPREKLIILQQSIQTLTRAGYVYIGMDHFALANDDLAIAQRTGKLHRNFQGYATHGNCDLFSFGVSSINGIANTFAQNAKNIEDYNNAIENGSLPITRGIALTSDDILRREVIRQLICDFNLNIPNIEQRFSIKFEHYFFREIESLTPLAEDGLIEKTIDSIRVTPAGRLLIRSICMKFDLYLQNKAENSPKYSRII